jgi:hypothetical protein
MPRANTRQGQDGDIIFAKRLTALCYVRAARRRLSAETPRLALSPTPTTGSAIRV